MSIELANAIATLILTGMAAVAIIRLLCRVDILQRQAKETETHFATLIEIVDSLRADVRQLQRDRDGIGPK
ncbi:hypothetical protein [Embleya sp. NPDC005971]|uniref:hypothetical protein n=1 Tax=Embleya sp. NPDC005971 TaxID=3156724 RepID=UPI0033CFB270